MILQSGTTIAIITEDDIRSGVDFTGEQGTIHYVLLAGKLLTWEQLVDSKLWPDLSKHLSNTYQIVKKANYPISNTADKELIERIIGHLDIEGFDELEDELKAYLNKYFPSNEPNQIDKFLND